MTYTYRASKENPYQLAVGLVVYDHQQDKVLVIEERDGSFHLPIGVVEDSENLRDTIRRTLDQTVGLAAISNCYLGSAHLWNQEEDYEQTVLYHLMTNPLLHGKSVESIEDHPDYTPCWLTPEQSLHFLGPEEQQMVRRFMHHVRNEHVQFAGR
jgi:hypothetical protein